MFNFNRSEFLSGGFNFKKPFTICEFITTSSQKFSSQKFSCFESFFCKYMGLTFRMFFNSIFRDILRSNNPAFRIFFHAIDSGFPFFTIGTFYLKDLTV